MTADHVVRLEVPDAAGVTFRVRAVHGREVIHEPYRFTVECELVGADGRRADVDPNALVGAAATIGWATAEGEERALEGVVTEVASSFGQTDMTIEPAIAMRSDASDYRVFVDQHAVTIAEKVMSEHGIKVNSRVSRTPDKRAQYLQPFESDLDFVGRILADEGIAFYLKPNGKEVVLADQPEGFDALPAALPVRDAAAMVPGDAVFRPRLSRRAVVREVVLRDYDFEKPQLDLTKRSGAEDAGATQYEFPGGYLVPGAGQALADARLAELQKHEIVIEGETNARFLHAGSVLSIEDAPRDELNGDFLLVSVVHEMFQHDGAERPYRARFRAVPAARGYRPDRRPAPRLGGVEHAVVTGASGKEIHTEEHARVHVTHRWDYRSSGNDKSSAFVRTVQPNTYGSIFIPRVGWETLVGFVNGAQDEPVALGRVYNAETPPPAGLPGAKIESALTSRTTPGGGSANRIGTNDSAGAEGMAFHASKDYEERSANDKVTAIKANDKWDVGAKHTLAVGTVFMDQVIGPRNGTIAAYHGINVGANYSMKASNEVVVVGGARITRTGGNNGTICENFIRLVGCAEAQAPIEHQTRNVKAASLAVNTGNWINRAGASTGVSIGGASVLKVNGAQTINAGTYSCNVKGALWESYDTRKVTGPNVVDAFRFLGTFKTDGAATFTGTVNVEATSKLTIEAGGVTITMTPSSIKISGKFDGQDSVITCDATKVG